MTVSPQNLPELALTRKFDELENAWLECVEGKVEDLGPFVEAASVLEKEGQREQAGVLLALLVPSLKEAGRWQDDYDILLQIGRLAPGGLDFRAELVSCLEGLHAECTGLSAYLQIAKLDRGRNYRGDLLEGASSLEGLKKLESFLDFPVGRYVHHKASWGTGVVKAVDERTGELTLTFEKKESSQTSYYVGSRFSSDPGR